MKILVTGGAGFIGSHLIDELREQRYLVISFDKVFPKAVKTLELDEAVENKIGLYEESVDFCNFNLVREFFETWRPDVVCHLGAVPSVKLSIDDPLGTMENNIRGTWNIFEAARLTGVKRVVFISSGAVYGQTASEYSGKLLHEDLPLKPLNPYALSKKMGEEMARVWTSQDIWKGPDIVCLRPSNVFGSRQRRGSGYASCIENFLWQWREGKPLTVVPDGKQRRDMVYVKDVVRAVRLAAESTHRFGGVPINIGSGENYSILEVADLVGGKGYPRVFIEPRVGEIRETKFDIERARVLLGWKPEVSFEKGIEILKSEKVT